MQINSNRQQLCKHTHSEKERDLFTCKRWSGSWNTPSSLVGDPVPGFTAAAALYNVGGMRKMLLNELRTSRNIFPPPRYQCNLLPAQWIVTVPPQDRLHWREAPREAAPTAGSVSSLYTRVITGMKVWPIYTADIWETIPQSIWKCLHGSIRL